MRNRIRSKKYFVNNLAKGWRGDSEGHRLAAMGYRVRTAADARRPPLDFSRIQRDEPMQQEPLGVDVGTSGDALQTAPSQSVVQEQSQDVAFIPGYRRGTAVVATPGVPPAPSSILEQSGGPL